jgi:small subunit ribosomal protein S4e
MARGLRKHLKRLNAPSHWMLNKLGGAFAPKPTQGPHKLRECLPLVILIRNRLKYALTRGEVTSIVMQRLIKVDGKVRTDINFPTGFMDVITIEKTNEYFRLLYDTKGRFVIHRVNETEAKFKLCKVRKVELGPKGIPYLVTNDAKTIRFPNPDIKVNDTIKLDLATGKITEMAKMDVGNLVMITGGKNLGRVGVITRREKHPGSFEIIHVKDAKGNSFSTRLSNVFVIGKGTKSLVTLPRGKGIKKNIIEELHEREHPNKEAEPTNANTPVEPVTEKKK